MAPDVESEAMERVIVGRRPVFDSALDVIGYRLVLAGAGYRSPVPLGEAFLARGPDGGIARWCGSKLVFIDPSRDYFTRQDAIPLRAAGQLVLGVDPSFASDAEVVEGCIRRVSEGCLIALHHRDGAHSQPVAAPTLAALASFMKFDLGTGCSLESKEGLAAARALGLRPVAAGVDHQDQFQAAVQAGFDLFEGYLFSEPTNRGTGALTSSRVSVLRMIETVNDPDTSAADLQKVVEADAGLSYRLLHVSGLGAAGGLRRPVRSIREAAVLLGREWIHRWLMLMLMADASEGTAEQLTIAMARGRMAELVASWSGRAAPDSAFTVGLLSALDLVLGTPLDEAISKLAITGELVDALLQRRGPLGDVLDDVIAWEVGLTPEPSRSGLGLFGLERCYLDALAWTNGVSAALESAGPAAPPRAGRR